MQVDSPGLTPAYVVTPGPLQHAHTLESPTLGTVGQATIIQVRADELYAIDLATKEQYTITLTATPILK